MRMMRRMLEARECNVPSSDLSFLLFFRFPDMILKIKIGSFMHRRRLGIHNIMSKSSVCCFVNMRKYVASTWLKLLLVNDYVF